MCPSQNFRIRHKGKDFNVKNMRAKNQSFSPIKCEFRNGVAGSSKETLA